MRNNFFIIVLASFLFVSCATTNKRISSTQQAAGAFIITGAAIGGAFLGAEISDEKSAAAVSVLTAIGCAGIAGFIYDFYLDVFDMKENIPQNVPEKDSFIQDFMLPDN